MEGLPKNINMTTDSQIFLELSLNFYGAFRGYPDTSTAPLPMWYASKGYMFSTSGIYTSTHANKFVINF